RDRNVTGVQTCAPPISVIRIRMTGCGVHQILRPAPRTFQNRQRYGFYNKEAQHHHRIDNINEILLQIQSADKRNVFLLKTDQPRSKERRVREEYGHWVS